MCLIRLIFFLYMSFINLMVQALVLILFLSAHLTILSTTYEGNFPPGASFALGISIFGDLYQTGDVIALSGCTDSHYDAHPNSSNWAFLFCTWDFPISDQHIICMHSSLQLLPDLLQFFCCCLVL